VLHFPHIRGRLGRSWALDALLALGFVGLILAWLLDPAHRPGAAEGNDFAVFYRGAAAFAAGMNPYAFGFVSPPPFALLLRPLASLEPEAAAMTWFLLSVVALVAVSAASLHLAAVPARVWAGAAFAIALFLWPANNYGLLLGQSSVLVALLVTLAVSAAGARPAAAGALLAIGAVAKPHLVLLTTLGLAADEWRRGRRPALAGAFALTGALLAGASILQGLPWIRALIYDPPESWNYWGSTIGTNVFLAVLLADRAAGWFLLVVLGSALLCSLAVWWWRAAPGLAQLTAVLISATLLVTPYAYPHDYILLAFPAVWVAARLGKLAGARSLPLVVLIGIVAWFAPIPAAYDDGRFVALALPATLVTLARVLPTGTGA
jgi:hypothetical protein